jgi:tRNA threonylcarbamoyl adenosine modification protein YeaZ
MNALLKCRELFYARASPVIILAIETSTTSGSIAVLDDSRQVFNESFSAERGHGAHFFVVLERALAIAPAPAQIAVGLGPGSYSGVRIAISAAIGIGLGTGALLVGVPSVAAFAGDEYVAIGDARRGTFYFSHVHDGEVIEGPQLLDLPALGERLAQTQLPVFASEKVELFRATLCFPAAEKIARLALLGRSVIMRERLEPIYLRDPHITVSRASASSSAFHKF